MKNNYEKEIQDLLMEMTIEEKVGQLQQCGPSLVGAFDVSFEELVNMVFDGRISKADFQNIMSSAKHDFHEEDLRAGKIGSYNGLNDAKTANELQKIAVTETRLGIPLLFGYDVIHGYRTVTPIPLAESCAWEPELWERTARIAAEEATAGGVHMTFAPMVDVSRDARWGRVSEGAGEDVLLSSIYGAAKVKGFQGDDLTKEDAMAACVKHFAAYGAAEAGKDYNRVDMSMQRLFEEYLPPFEACVKAGARAIMPAFNDINGIPCSVNHWLLTNLLRNQWGFDGMTISDANAIAECVTHGIAENTADAAKQAIEAGLDMDMTSNAFSETLVKLIAESAVSVEALDKAVANVLRVKFDLGLFDHPYQTSEEREKAVMLKPAYRSLAREAAEKSIVLLKNETLLPLKPGIKLGIAGEQANNRGEMTGAWAIKADVEDCVSLIDACMTQGIDYVYLEENTVIPEDCDVFVAAVGEMKNQSGEAASRASIELPADQINLLKKLIETGKPVIALLFNGRPLAIPWVAEHVSAIIEAWHPGVEAGNAILNVLFGKVNPSAKLTTTFPYASGQCPIYYAHMNTGRPGGKSKFTSKYLDTPLVPVYPFGHGLSYTTFAYSELQLSEGQEGVTASVKVRNTGDREGTEIVQCYIRDIVAKRIRPVKQLVDFSKIPLQAGEEREVVFYVPYHKMGYYDMNMRHVVEEGEFELFVGGNSVDCLSNKFRL
ncbi:beta-glucosidase [Paenibacillus sp. CF095]|uniref:glycoside hydrolase family 3 N-terminal domain-containing protein n=1 Tax=Paenibacillus sp. CF095 TaxID=1881033 RepID=UPI00087ECB7A|nr:glycoside hydrolase family 3 N-terminal domain-containing protein [Paenibacillus sp. CF095]SDD53734.1 beta-glucosidase [Paenibacillus sp. CF095]